MAPEPVARQRRSKPAYPQDSGVDCVGSSELPGARALSEAMANFQAEAAAMSQPTQVQSPVDEAQVRAAAEQSVQAVFEDELRRCAFRMADEDGLNKLPEDECRTVLRSLATTESQKKSVEALKLPEVVSLDDFLRFANEAMPVA
eukprot:gnl/MRDRNA2_/MRDRNA2_123214_c0_seq1.p1 gnl/MRDRNA2_/MRDRNA2_123214_c0~~gnl/MRDRNA2_/MRDRNA2_123214_c0_seq1.p1  ORF type:complete len:145 (-),score=38.47 gnl/MRDRNA2_/MRDRNA2_123214_c0_seq1:123-557(-)